MDKSRRDPVAIVGIGCRFPGGARDVGSYWQLLEGGIDAVTVPPDSRKALILQGQDIAPGASGAPACQGGYLEKVDQFDTYFFDLSPREAEAMDPQQRLLTEVAYESIENAGIPLDTLAGTRAGVFVGLWTGDYENYLFKISVWVRILISRRNNRSKRWAWTLSWPWNSVTS